jgi:predicted phosphodiesterase
VSTQRIALLSDIHGNALAFKTVLADIRRNGAELVVLLGDVCTMGPSPLECLELAREHCDICIMGNHDAYMIDPELDDDHLIAPQVKRAVDWCRDQLSEEDRLYLKGFSPTKELVLNRKHKLLCFHGTPRSHTENLLPTMPSNQLIDALGDSDANIFAGGHTHVQAKHQLNGRMIVNAGSVGMPFEKIFTGDPPVVLPFADYAWIDIDGEELRVEMRRIDLNVQKLTLLARDWGQMLGQELARSYEEWA